MPGPSTESDSSESAAEYLRLALAKLSQYKLPVSAVNYALLYFYVSGKDLTLNSKLDAMFEDMERWTDESARSLFTRFICQCSEGEFKELREELLMTVAQILGSVVDIAGHASLNNAVLEGHIEKLASTDSPKEILNIAANIIADTRSFVEKSRSFENNLVETTQEINILKDELDQARRMATTDALTGLHNRRGFDAALLRTVDECLKTNSLFSLLILDIDHFKVVNDTHGHLVGDKVLIGISKLLHNQMRGNDYLSRFGGEEFAVLLLDTPITGAFTVAENLRKTVEKLRLKHVKTGQRLDQVTISIGVASYRKGEQVKDFIQRSDNALYRAKSLGRNRTVLAD